MPTTGAFQDDIQFVRELLLDLEALIGKHVAQLFVLRTPKPAAYYQAIGALLLGHSGVRSSPCHIAPRSREIPVKMCSNAKT